MFCPIQSNRGRIWPRKVECQKAQCAWWDRRTDTCQVPQLVESIDFIADFLQSLRNGVFSIRIDDGRL